MRWHSIRFFSFSFCSFLVEISWRRDGMAGWGMHRCTFSLDTSAAEELQHMSQEDRLHLLQALLSLITSGLPFSSFVFEEGGRFFLFSCP